MQKYYAGITERMLSEIETISDRMSHAGEKGRNNEFVLRDFLNEMLPKRYSVSSGKVVAADGRDSGQMDLIVHDRLNTPALMDARAWSLVPVESVYAVISVKTTLTKNELRDASSCIASVRELPRSAAIRYETDFKVHLQESETLRPRSIVFAFKTSWRSSESAVEAFRDVLVDIDDSHRPNVVCILDQCLLIRRPYTTETIVFREHVLMHFFMYMVQMMDTFPRYQTDLERYFVEDYGNQRNDRT